MGSIDPAPFTVIPPSTARVDPACRVLVMVFCYNEEKKIGRVLERFPADGRYAVCVMNDGSTDGSVEVIRRFPGVGILSHDRNRGAGSAIRTAHRYGLEAGYEVFALVAGNDKDRPAEVGERLLPPILNEGYDLVQGSRYLPGSDYGNMPLYRRVATNYVHPWLFSLVCGRRITDSTNGFRCYRARLLQDPRLDLMQEWLSQYELEPYLFYKAIKLGYKVKEVPVSKIYPPHELGYTKMRPITGWWSILRPLVFLGLRIKK